MKNSGNSPASTAVLLALLLIAGHSCHARDPATSAGQFRYDGEMAVLPMVPQRTHPIVQVDVGDGEQREFIVDTGAGVNVIDTSIASRFGYAIIGETEIGAPGGRQIQANLVKVPVLQLNGATVIDAEFATMDLLEFSGGQIQGVLGVGLFREHLVTFDLRTRKIIVADGDLSTALPGVIQYDPSELQLSIAIDVAGMSVPTHIDTGSMGGFTLPAELSGTLPLSKAPQAGATARLVGGDRDIQVAQLEGAIRFAGFSHENPVIAFMSPSPGAANIGTQILERYLLTIDQRRHLLQFREHENRSARTAGKPRRLGVRFRGVPGGKVLTVASVDPGSLGESAGILPGDVLMTINGRSTTEYSMSDLGAIFGSSANLLLGIDREGETLDIAIP